MRHIAVTAFILALALGGPSAGQEPRVRTIDVFRRAQEGYHTFRIPALTVAADGSLLAIVEGRRDRAHDPGGGHIDLVYKRSLDGGLTWSPLEVLHPSEENWGASNPAPVLDAESGLLLVVYNVWKPDRGGRNSRPGTDDCQVFLRVSGDNGQTWSPPADLTDVARDDKRWATAVVGPGRGIDLGQGRLVVPVYVRDDDVRALALISQDGGETWRRGERFPVPSNECQVADINPDRILLDARQDDRELEHRWMAESVDGGRSWSKPWQGVKATPVNAALLAYPRPDDLTAKWILWTGPRGPVRNNLVLRISTDFGRTFPHERLIAEGRAAYSSMAALEAGSVGVLWERGQSRDVPGGTVPETVTLTILPSAWVVQTIE